MGVLRKAGSEAPYLIPQTSDLRRRRADLIPRAVARGPLHLVVIAIALLWLVPTAGLLVSSFRPAAQITASGWWHAFSPFDFTLENYRHVLDTNNMQRSFVNSLF